jgi:hypothetical protein
VDVNNSAVVGFYHVPRINMSNGAIGLQPLRIRATGHYLTRDFTREVSAEEGHHTHFAKVQLAGFYRLTGFYFAAAEKFQFRSDGYYLHVAPFSDDFQLLSK